LHLSHLVMVSYVKRDTFEIFESIGSDSPGVAVYPDTIDGVIATWEPSNAQRPRL